MESDDPHKVLSYFPGICFLGPFLEPAGPDDVRAAMGVLRSVRNVHAMLDGLSSNDLAIDSTAIATATRLESALTTPWIKLSRGGGYTSELNAEDTIPACHIYHLTMSLPSNYLKWLETRILSYNSLSAIIPADLTFYLRVSDSTKLVAATETAVEMDVYGTQTLHPDYQEWLGNYEMSLADEDALSGLELIAGISHIVDTLASMHLLTSLPIIVDGRLERRTASDSLTDLWLGCYEMPSESNYVIGSCCVCGKLFVGTSKRKRGHAACMNRARVKRAKARKFAHLIADGITEQEASRQASISPDSARMILDDLGETSVS